MNLTDDHAVERLEGQLRALTEISKTLTLSDELPELLDLVMKRIVSVLPPAHAAAVMLWDQPSGLFRPAAIVGFDAATFVRIGLRAGESITGKVFDSGRSYLLTGAEQVTQAMADMRPANRSVFFDSIGKDRTPICILAAPISVWGATVGARAIPALYGSDWAAAGPLCSSFFALFAVTYLVTPLSLCLYVMEKTWVNMLINIVSAALIVGLNLVLVPRYGMWGALAPVGVVILGSPWVYRVLVRRWLPQVGVPWGFILRCYAAAAPLAALGLATRQVRSLHGLLALSAVAGVVSLLCIRFFGLLGQEERQLLEKLRLPLRQVWLKLLFRGEVA